MNKINVLIADDNQDTRNQILKYFRNSDHISVVGEVDNGMKALAIMQNVPVDAVILDIVMPELDGFGVLKQLRNFPGKKPYIIMISRLHSDACVNRALSEGADYYLMKPLNMQSLHEQLLLLLTKNTLIPAPAATTMALTQQIVPPPPLTVTTSSRGNTLDERITHIFLTVGIPAHIKGYQFLREAIKLVVDSPDMINCITKRLYPTVAGNFLTSPSKVERAIRHAIEVAWSRGKMTNLNILFGAKNICEYKPTNGEFIALIADKMKIEGGF